MPISRLPAKLVVDATPILSAVIGGASNRVFWSPEVQEFATTAWTLEEVSHYLPKLANKVGFPVGYLQFSMDLLPLQVYERSFYMDQIEQATLLIGHKDPKDTDILALALQLGYPLWTNDKDFEEVGIRYYPTAVLLKILDTA